MSGEVVRAEKDFTKEVDKLIPEVEALAKKNPQAAIDRLLVLEKQTRQASDLPSTSKILTKIVRICKDAGDWKLLDEQVVTLSKKHGQLKQATTKMVQEVMSYLDDTPNLDRKLATIETLRTVTEGKIFVEVERARVTRILSSIKQEQGDIKAARDILTELQVETFGSMSRREKTEFILDQIQLCIDSGDWTQAGILGRKIGTKYFGRKPKKTPEQIEKDRKEREEAEKKRSVDDPIPEPEDDVTDLKLRYYEQQIMLAKHDDKYLEACKHYRQVLDTEHVEEDKGKLEATLQRVAWYILLAPYDNEQSDLLHRIKADTRYADLPREQQLLRLFTTPEIMHWPNISQSYASYLGASDVFRVSGTTSAASPSDERATTRWDDLRKRVIEHNVRVVAKYYTRISMPRLCQLLNLSEDETEKYISDLVTAKTIYAKIDRPARIVSFAKPRDADDVLNEWSGNMKSLLGLLERIDHLITKEEMMARIAPKAVKAKPRQEDGAAVKA